MESVRADMLEFRIGDIYQDSDVLKAASDAAGGILELDRELDLPQHEKLKERLNAYMKYDLEKPWPVRLYREIDDEKNKKIHPFFGNNCARKQKLSGF